MTETKVEKKKTPKAPAAAGVVKPKKSRGGLSKAKRMRTGKGKTGTLRKDLPAVPESVLKRRKRHEEGRVQRIKSRAEDKKKRRQRRVEIFKRAEKYVKEYHSKEREEIRLKRLARKSGNYYVPDEPKLAFVIRIRGINKVHPRVRKTLQLFRLRQINNGVFVRLNKATLSMLRIVEPYVAWGYPSLSVVRELIYKRGFLRILRRRTPIISNAVIEKVLGKRNIICVEDLVHEIFTVGKNFRKASNTLWSFKLKTPTGGWRKKANHFVEGGDFGNREHKINELLKRMI